MKIDEIRKYFMMINIISIIALNSYELRKIFKTDKKSSEKTTSILGKIEGARDISKIFYDLVSLNIISLATTLLPKYGLAFRAYKKIKNKIKSMVCHRDVYEL